MTSRFSSTKIGGVLVLCLMCTGCKTLEPFNQSMRTRVAAAREWTGNGLDAIKRGSLHEARDCFTKASSQLPNDHRIVANVARTHFKQGQVANAIEVMRKAVDLAPHDSSLHAELGEFYLATGNTELASRCAKSCLENNQRHASGWLLKGKIKAANGNLQAALGDYQRALGIDADREDIRLEVVRTYQHLGQPLRALSAVEQLLEKYPQDRQPEEAILAKCDSLQKLQQFSPAIEILESASSRKDISAQIFISLASVQQSAGRSPAAYQTLVKAQQRFPSQAQISQMANQLRANDTRVASMR